ncbi:phage major capsid protein [Aliidiomarina iranensis]|uniref:Phage major capsid protein n=1 Tax=Aliidiomarina iranensis TaxID=1434071 RepID=A0A432W0B1_9GAMM|nr:phage major capsid protein [Aliidiomarina iranensis]RUO22428.1 phage major capsid protein [Aliidiomarina iranensis]
MNHEIKEMAAQINTAATEVKSRLSEAELTVKSFEDRLTSIEVASKRPYAGNVTESKSDPELKGFLTKGTSPMERKDLSVTNDGQGVSVRSQWSDRIFKLIREFSPIRSVASVMRTNSDSLEVLIDREEPQSDWIGELDPRNDTSTSFLTRHRINVHEHYAYPSITLQMLEDSNFDVEQWLQSKLVTKFSRQEADAFINGDGNGKPRGILNYSFVPEADFTWGADPDLYEMGSQYTGAAGDISSADVLFDLVDSLKSNYLPGASFMMTRAMRNKIRKLKDAENRYLLEPSLTAGAPDRLLGYPVAIAEDMPALAADVVGVLFGNFNEGYTIVDRVDLSVQRDAVTRPGWVKYFARRRTGGALTNPEAVKALVLGTEPV